jgi:uncharacterized membrane protein
MRSTTERDFPIFAGIFFGLGLGGFFDGIVLHQLLQWHHMLSGWHPVTDVASLKFNTFWDGMFHSATYVFVVTGLVILWRTAHRPHLHWSNKSLWGSLLLGFGIFNSVEGIMNHQVLGIHHVNETVSPDQQIMWDIAFIAWGIAMIISGALLLRRGGREVR